MHLRGDPAVVDAEAKDVLQHGRLDAVEPAHGRRGERDDLPVGELDELVEKDVIALQGHHDRDVAPGLQGRHEAGDEQVGQVDQLQGQNQLWGGLAWAGVAWPGLVLGSRFLVIGCGF